MTWKDYFDNWEEIIIDGICSSIFLYWIVGWWVIPLAVLCGFLWRLGGVTGGSKLYRRLGVPLLICGATFLTLHHWSIFLAIPFMVWPAPSYGKDSWLFKLLKNDFLTRLICFAWYWLMFSLATIPQM
jgi:hypothetical protein